jgi:hypothetical protein
MKAQTAIRNVLLWVLILGVNFASVTVAKADDPVSPPNRAARIFPPVGQPRSLSPEELEIIKKRQRELEAEYAARPKPPPPPTGIISGDVGEQFGSYHRMENAWHEIVDGKDVWVYAGARIFDPSSQVMYDPLTVHGLIVIEIGSRGQPNFRGKRLYTPTGVGSLRIIAAEGNILTLQSRQGHKFSLDVQTEELTPLGSR